MISSDSAYDLFVKIANTSGSAKKPLLGQYTVERYLLAAYDPFTKYYMTKCFRGRGHQVFDELTWTILGRLSTRELSGDKAQSIVNVHTMEMTEKSSNLFRMILNKDLKMGMGSRTINKVFPGLIPTHDVMLAKLFENKRLKYPCFGSPKIDGVRAKFKNGKFFSRNGHEYVGLDHLAKELSSIDGELDGELVVPNITFQVSSGLVRDNSPTPNAAFHVFEVPSYKGSFIERLVLMDDLHYIGPHILKVPHMLLDSENGVHEFYADCRAAGYEGAVIKPYDYEYKGTRSYDWMKMKPKENKDVIVTGLYEGKGKYKGQMGGVIVDFNSGNSVGGGWSNKQREFFWKNPSLLIGQCIEVSYMELTDKGNFRHANFERIREDKS